MKDEGKEYVAMGRRLDGSGYSGKRWNNLFSACQEALGYATDSETTMVWVDEIRTKRMFLVDASNHPKSDD